MRLKIAVLAGDGIGPEIMEQGVAVTRAVARRFGHDVELRCRSVRSCGRSQI